MVSGVYLKSAIGMLFLRNNVCDVFLLVIQWPCVDQGCNWLN